MQARWGAVLTEKEQDIHPLVLSAKALYLQPSSSALNTGGYQTFNGFNSYENAGNNWGFGFALDATYYYRPTLDVDLNWYSINSQKTDYLVGPMTDAAGAYIAGPKIQNLHQPTWNAVNLEFGKTVDFHEQRVRFYAGLEYVNIKEKLIFQSPGVGSDAIYRSHDITYHGVGPRIGGDVYQRIGDHAEVYAKGALGLSTGPTKETAEGITADGVRTSSALPSTFIVPDVSIKLGVTYAYPIAHHNMMVDVGWLWINYFEPLITRVGGIVHAENFGFQGPYAGLSYKW